MRPALLAAALALAAALRAATLPVDALPADFLRGERPAAWAKGEIAVVECWARWCGPCLRAMPHLEALWRELGDEGVRVIGVNVSDKGSDAEILAFLAKQPTPPTYALAVDRAGALPKRLGVKGIPFAAVVREGEVVWQGHPAALTAERLRALRDGRLEAPPPDADPMAETRALEARADAAAAKGDWAAAARLQRRALEAHPLAKARGGTLPDLPAAPALAPAEPPAPETRTDAGDAAPYAALVGPLPADDLPTLVAYWPNPFWVAKLTWTTLATLPERRVAKALPYPHRTLTLAPAKASGHLGALLAPLPELARGLRFADAVPGDLFGADDRHNPPYVAYFRGGRLLWKGPLETLPAAFRTPNPPADPQAARDAAAQEEARGQAVRDAFARLVKAERPDARAAILAEIDALGPLPRGWGTLLAPQALADAYRAKDVPAGRACARRLLDRFWDDPGALEMLRKAIVAWPELALETRAEQCRIAERLGELNDRDDPLYAQAWFGVAADEAKAFGDEALARRLLTRALLASPTALRLRQFQNRLPALPAR